MKIQCPSCHNHCQYPNNFCTFCGSPLPQIAICQNCGSKINEDNAFCTYCGMPKNAAPQNQESAQKLESAKTPNNQSHFVDPPNDSVAAPQTDTVSTSSSEKKQNYFERLWKLTDSRLGRHTFTMKAIVYNIGIILSLALVMAIYLKEFFVYSLFVTSMIKYSGFVVFLKCAYGLFVTTIARVHDINLSGWYLIGYYVVIFFLLATFNVKNVLIPLFLFVLPQLILMVKNSYPYANKWGEPPEV